MRVLAHCVVIMEAAGYRHLGYSGSNVLARAAKSVYHLTSTVSVCVCVCVCVREPCHYESKKAGQFYVKQGVPGGQECWHQRRQYLFLVMGSAWYVGESIAGHKFGM